MSLSEQARRVADRMHPTGQAYEAKLLRSLADDRDKLLSKLAEAKAENEELVKYAESDWNGYHILRLNKELAEARAEIERLSVYNHDLKTQHDLLKAERDAEVRGGSNWGDAK